MNIQDFAEKLHQSQYGCEITMSECNLARELGYVAVFGYSDDGVELRGAIHEEVGCCDGGEVFITKDGIFEECECNCKYSREAKEKCKKIEAIWCGDSGYAWEYKTDIPHVTFEVLDGGDAYCKGIVFDIKNL